MAAERRARALEGPGAGGGLATLGSGRASLRETVQLGSTRQRGDVGLNDTQPPATLTLSEFGVHEAEGGIVEERFRGEADSKVDGP